MVYYEIRRGVKPGVQLTPSQRGSSMFAEEPVVLGTVFRRGLPPMKISEKQFQANKVQLMRLEHAGAIEILKLTGSEVPADLDKAPVDSAETKVVQDEQTGAPVVPVVQEVVTSTPEPVTPVVEQVVAPEPAAEPVSEPVADKAPETTPEVPSEQPAEVESETKSEEKKNKKKNK